LGQQVLGTEKVTHSCPCTREESIQESGNTAPLFLTWTMEESGQLGASSALLLGKDPPVPIKQTAGWAPESTRTFRKIAGLVTDRTVRSLVIIPVTLSRVA